MSPDSGASGNVAGTNSRKQRDAEGEFAFVSGSVVDALPGLVWTARLDGHVDYLNKRWFEFTGLNSDELHGQGWQTAIHPEDLPTLLERWQSILASAKPGEMEARLRRFDGEYRRFLFRTCPLVDASGQFVKWCGINTDLEDQRPAEDTAALKRSEARKAAILDAALDCIVTINHEGCITEFNPAAERTFGFSRDQVMGKPLADVIIPPSLREQHRRGFARFLTTGEARVVGKRIEITAVRADGKEFPVELAITRIPWDGPPWFTGYIRDITESKQRAEELRRSAAYLAEAQKLSLTGSFGWNVSSGELFWSDETFSILGYDRATNPSLDLVLKRVHPDDIALFNQTLGQATDEKAALNFEHRLLLPDGSVKYVRVVAHALDHESGRSEFVGAVMDVTTHHKARIALEKAFTEINNARAELAHVGRMTTMGELAASIAHEVNQPLAAVVTNADACMRFLKHPVPDLDEVRAAIRSIIRDGNRGSEVIGRIRAFLKKEQPSRIRVNVNESVEEIVRLAQFELHGTDVQLGLAERLPCVCADRVQLQQVLLNLMINAIDAMKPVSGRPRVLRIETTRHESDAVLVAIQDSGVGFSPESMEQLFETFYTTKPEGLGMGLSISHSIIENHGGRLWAKCNEGPGATFLFTIPAETKEPHDNLAGI